jgi:hypothetical protein
MDIFINNKQADITLETEKTVGELLAGIEGWLVGTGSRISGIEIDGQVGNAGDLESIFERELAGLSSVNIGISSLLELAAEALVAAKSALLAYGNVGFDEKRLIKASFESCAASRFLGEQMPDIAGIVLKTLAGDGPTPEETAGLIDERMREVDNPAQEIENCGPLVSEIASRLEDLPLDMQTGKDRRAMETMRLFSGIAEKLFRLLSALKQRGLVDGDISIDGRPAKQFIDDFSAAIGELLGAYDAHDTVLTGDLAEYEMSPRLIKLYDALRNVATEASVAKND